MSLTRNQKRLILAGLILLLALGTWAYFRAEARVKHVQQLRQELLSEEGRKLSTDQQRAKARELVEEFKDLSFSDKRRLAEETRGRQAQRDKLRRFAEASPKEKLAILDEDIKKQEQLRRVLKLRLPAGGTSTASKGNGQRAPLVPGLPGGGLDQRPASLNREQLERWRKEMLDMTPPEERAQRSLYYQRLADRREQLGLSN